MKMKIFLSSIVLIIFSLLVFSQNKKRVKSLSKENNPLIENVNSSQKLSKEIPKSLSLDASSTLSEIESELSHLDLHELKTEVKKFNANKEYLQLLANAHEQILTQSERHLLSSFLKRKGLLHKLIMDKELDQIESEEL